VLDALPDSGTVVIDADLRVATLAGSMFAGGATGLRPGRLLAESLSPAAWSKLGPRVRAALAGDAQHFDHWTTDGTRCYWIHLLPVVDAHDRPAGAAVALLQETTARREELDRLHESEALLRSMIAAMEEGVLTVDAHGVLLTVNDAACRMLGRSAEELYGDPRWWERVDTRHPDGTRVTPATSPAATAMRSGAVLRDVPLRIERPDGSAIEVAATYAPLRGPGRVDRGLLLCLRDTTVTQWARAAVVESAMEAIVSVDHAGRVVEFNPAAERLFGYARHQALGRELAGLIRDERLAAFARRAREGARFWPRRMELAGRRRDGSAVAVEVAVSTTPGASGGFTLFMRELAEASPRPGVPARA
jgi:PAS domain S-box-containing protein